MNNFRIEKDSLGEIKVPADKYYGAQTQRAFENFKISDKVFPLAFINAIVLIKKTAALTNKSLGILDPKLTEAIVYAADEVLAGKYSNQFPLDIFQTGSGTSTNMNVNEVLAKIASDKFNIAVNANDHVNMSQSSNDVIPTAIHISACLKTANHLIPGLKHLAQTINKKAKEIGKIVKTGRTHLMDAMPITFAQELGGWELQVNNGIDRLNSSLTRLQKLAQGGTAVGSGINADSRFAAEFVKLLNKETKLNFKNNDSFFESLSSQDAAVEHSGQLKTIAVGLIKISNDLRLMNSGPLAGIGDIELKALQPGSSIMPGKVNPVIPEAVIMAGAQVIGNDATITYGGSFGNFQLNVMLPVIAYNLLESIDILAGSVIALADNAIALFAVNNKKIESSLSVNPILVTALNSVIGYAEAAKIAKKAYAENRPIIDVALEMTNLSKEKLTTILDPINLTRGGIAK